MGTGELIDTLRAQEFTGNLLRDYLAVITLCLNSPCSVSHYKGITSLNQYAPPKKMADRQNNGMSLLYLTRFASRLSCSH